MNSLVNSHMNSVKEKRQDWWSNLCSTRANQTKIGFIRMRKLDVGWKRCRSRQWKNKNKKRSRLGSWEVVQDEDLQRIFQLIITICHSTCNSFRPFNKNHLPVLRKHWVKSMKTKKMIKFQRINHRQKCP